MPDWIIWRWREGGAARHGPSMLEESCMTRWMGSPAYRGRTSTRGACWAWTRRLRGSATTRDQELMDACDSAHGVWLKDERWEAILVLTESISLPHIGVTENPRPSFPRRLTRSSFGSINLPEYASNPLLLSRFVDCCAARRPGRESRERERETRERG